MDDFNISVSRIEVVGRVGKNTEVCVTFTFERGPIVFQVPLFLEHADFDDTEHGQGTQRLTDKRPAHAELTGKLPLGNQTVTGLQRSREQAVAQESEDLLEASPVATRAGELVDRRHLRPRSAGDHRQGMGPHRLRAVLERPWGLEAVALGHRPRRRAA